MAHIDKKPEQNIEFPTTEGLFGWSSDSNKLADLIKCKTFPAETIIYEKGSMSDDFYLILSGQARLVIHHKNDREITLRARGLLGGFGAFSAIDGEEREATLITNTNCLMGIIKAKDFKRFIKDTPDFAMVLLERFIREIRFLYRRVHEYNQHPVRQRLALEILREAHHHIQNGNLLEDYKLPTHTSLASLIDSTREGIAREMPYFYKEKALIKKGRRTIIKNLETLTKIARPLNNTYNDNFSQNEPYG